MHVTLAVGASDDPARDADDDRPRGDVGAHKGLGTDEGLLAYLHARHDCRVRRD